MGKRRASVTAAASAKKKRPGKSASGPSKMPKKAVMTIEQKIEVLDRLNGGETCSAVGRSLEINESSVRYIRDNSAKIRAAYADPTFVKGSKTEEVFVCEDGSCVSDLISQTAPKFQASSG